MFRIAVYRQQKAEMRLITHEKCAEEWGNDLGPLTKGQCEYYTYYIGIYVPTRVLEEQELKANCE